MSTTGRSEVKLSHNFAGTGSTSVSCSRTQTSLNTKVRRMMEGVLCASVLIPHKDQATVYSTIYLIISFIRAASIVLHDL